MNKEEKTIELSEIGNCATWSRRDNSPRGFETVPASAVRVGDEVLVNSHFVRVVSDLDAARAAFEENAEKIERAKAHADQVLAAWRSMTDAERVQHVKTTPREERIMREYDDAQKDVYEVENAGKILYHNLIAEVVAEIARVLPEILARFDGKKAGPATRKKICDEIVERVPGVWAWFEDRGINTARSDGLRISYERGARFYGYRESIYIYTLFDEAMKDRPDLISADNTINGKITRANIDLRHWQKIAMPALHLDKIREARAKIEEAQKAFNAASEEYNALIVDGFERADRIYNAFRK